MDQYNHGINSIAGSIQSLDQYNHGINSITGSIQPLIQYTPRINTINRPWTMTHSDIMYTYIYCHYFPLTLKTLPIKPITRFDSNFDDLLCRGWDWGRGAQVKKRQLSTVIATCYYVFISHVPVREKYETKFCHGYAWKWLHTCI